MAAPKIRNTGRRHGWLLLAAWLAGLWLFVFVLAPLGQRWRPWGDFCRSTEAAGIDAGAYFYTEVEVFSDAERTVRQRLECRRESTSPSRTPRPPSNAPAD